MLTAALPSRYRILEEVGQGGMAVVYRAQDETLCREVAVKVLHPHLLAEPESKARLEREARAVAKLNHDNILQIFDFSGGDALCSYIVTEFVDGETLKQFLAKRKLVAPEIAALIIIELGNALQHAHDLGIIHRDLKPENVMLRKDGVLKLMDFGVAQVIDLERMTVTGQILGSPAYLAPEVLDGRPLDFRSDVFSVGVMLYQLTTGNLPFAGKNPHEVLRRVSDGKFADPRTLNRLVTDSLARCISRALARKPEDRFPSIGAMVEELKCYVGDAGLRNAKEELRVFITDPEVFDADLLPRMVISLVASGQREQSAKRGGRALELWNRALAFDPENIAVLAELHRLERRERIRRIGIGASSLLILSGMVAVAYHLARRNLLPTAHVVDSMSSVSTSPKLKTPSPPVPPASSPNAKLLIQKQGLPLPLLSRSPKEGKRVVGITEVADSADKNATTDRAKSKPSEDVTLSLGFSPARVEVWLDGKHAFNYGPQQNRVIIPWDRTHKLEFRNDSCCSRKEVLVGPQTYRPPNDHLFVTLDPKPAHLTILFDPPGKGDSLLVRQIDTTGAKAWRTQATPGDHILVPFSSGEDMRKSLEIVVFKGEKALIKSLQITAGEKRNFAFSMDE